jgi:molybdate transport system substrate-binding protein
LEVAVKQIQGGETADIVILQREGIDALVKDGKAGGGSVSPIARVAISMAVRKGASKPDITSPDALKRTLLAAKSLTYLDPAAGNASGIQFAKVLDRLGIAKEMKGKTILARSTKEMDGNKEMEGLIASGKADLAINQTANLLTLSGIDIIGPVPGNLYQPIVFTAVIMNSAKDTGTAKALINFLRNPESAKVIKAKGMEPAK